MKTDDARLLFIFICGDKILLRERRHFVRTLEFFESCFLIIFWPLKMKFTMNTLHECRHTRVMHVVVFLLHMFNLRHLNIKIIPNK